MGSPRRSATSLGANLARCAGCCRNAPPGGMGIILYGTHGSAPDVRSFLRTPATQRLCDSPPTSSWEV